MKIRNGFVSNSSSSSFIVAVEDNDKPLKLMINIEKECEIIRTIDELSKCDRFDYYDDEDKEESDDWKKAVEAIKSGKVIKIFSASSDEDSIVSGLYGCTLKKEMFDTEVDIINDGDC